MLRGIVTAIRITAAVDKPTEPPPTEMRGYSGARAARLSKNEPATGIATNRRPESNKITCIPKAFKSEKNACHIPPHFWVRGMPIPADSLFWQPTAKRCFHDLCA